VGAFAISTKMWGLVARTVSFGVLNSSSFRLAPVIPVFAHYTRDYKNKLLIIVIVELHCCNVPLHSKTKED